MNPYIIDYEYTPIEAREYDTWDEYNLHLNLDTNNREFNIIYRYICSLSKNLDPFKIYLSKVRHDYDCIVLTEILKLDSLEIFQIDGYDTIYKEADVNRNDGVVVYIKKSMNTNIQ